MIPLTKKENIGEMSAVKGKIKSYFRHFELKISFKNRKMIHIFKLKFLTYNILVNKS